jgi:phospholipase C
MLSTIFSMRTARLVPAIATIVMLGAPLCSAQTGAAQRRPTSGATTARTRRPAPFDLNSIKHVIVIYQENWSFDGLYSQFPGTDRVPFGTAVAQYDAQGRRIDSMSVPRDDENHPFTGRRWKERMPASFYSLGDFTSGANPFRDSSKTLDVTHRFYHHQKQINGGANDRFLYWSDIDVSTPSGGNNMNPLTLSGVDASNMRVGRLAQEFVMCNRCFQSAFGGSFLNHQWLISARMPVFPDARHKAATAISDSTSPLPKNWDNKLSATPVPGHPDDFYAINTVQPPFIPTGPGLVLPPQTHPTIGDRLSDAGVRWKWYAQGWREAVEEGEKHGTSKNDGAFQYHHQPFNYFKKFDPATDEGRKNRREHLVDIEEFTKDLAAGDLPAVSFVKFDNEFDSHPLDATLADGEKAVGDLVAKIRASKAWDSCAIIITYDEFGGRWDHVKPPATRDGFGPGSRVPMIIASPFARRHAIDSTQYETVSILAFIEKRWNLQPLTDRDARAGNLLNAFAGAPATGAGSRGRR